MGAGVGWGSPISARLCKALKGAGWRSQGGAPMNSLLAGGGRGLSPVCPEDIPSCTVLFQPCLSSCPEGGGGRASLSWGPRDRGNWEREGGMGWGWGRRPASQAAEL